MSVLSSKPPTFWLRAALAFFGAWADLLGTALLVEHTLELAALCAT